MMKSVTRYFSAIFLFFLANISFSQTQGVAYTAVGKGVATTFVTDYHSLGINSSALGWGTGFEGKKFTLGTTEFSGGISSPSLNKDRLKNVMSSVRSQINKEEGFDFDQQKSAASDYAESGITVNASYNWFGASYQSEKFGGIAISINEEINWFSQLNRQTTDLIFRGKRSDYYDSLVIVYQGDTSTISNSGNISQDSLEAVIRGERNNPLLISQISDGSRIKFSWNRNFNIGYGRKILGDRETFALYAGVVARYIHSIAMFDMESNSNGLSLNSSLTPFFNIQYDNETTTTNSGTFPESVGKGYGLDFSTSVILLDRIKIAAAVNNIGRVTYKSNVYRVNDTLLGSTTMDGIEGAGFEEIMGQISEDGGLFSLENEKEVVVGNAATFRLGGSISFFDNMLDVGVDFVAPFNRDNPGSLQNSVFSIGGDIRPVKWLQLSAGYFGGGVYAHNVPVGINFILGEGRYEFGISSRDALSFFSKDGNSLSTAFGVARFRF
ncbi:hypothetical protein ERX46_10050 [Brumimicrobium glaciale]|uniref:DUF5723 domain-containing protein n=1 Tax=Brumimicrobium glaciale TaxID=200475 RepID=A0A4Q4KMY9_9FLAO|nr:DUF5723 family protein [Brumimicrobium glaciale]RYM33279.1 hypothetical protein ERX46_10050 [Brumimicrobium glaciale]